MPHTFLSHFPGASIDFKSYDEDLDYPSEGEPVPNTRSQTLIYRSNSSQWWIKVTFQGNIYSILDQPAVKLKRERGPEFQDFVRLIDYASISLLDDTVTELVLLPGGEGSSLPVIPTSKESINNPFAGIAAQLTYTTREDPLRVVYPLHDEFRTFQPIDMSELSEQEEIAAGVFLVLHSKSKASYVLKVVNRPLYIPHDTESIRKELENLEIFRNTPNIVQAPGVAVSINPYTTSRKSTGKQTLVIMGIILEYHSGGNLRTIFKEDPNRLPQYSWKKWPLQIATALSHFHAAKRTHMDIKTSNIVINADGNAILIDISGIGGFTHEWLAPEIREDMICMQSELPFKVRRRNDIWAFGRLLGQIASQGADCSFGRGLEQIAGQLMGEDVQRRMGLEEAMSRLSILAHSEGAPTEPGLYVQLVGISTWNVSIGTSCLMRMREISSPWRITDSSRGRLKP